MGDGAPANNNYGEIGSNGEDTSISGLATAKGGGAGATIDDLGQDGGSGGGDGTKVKNNGGQSLEDQGNNGGQEAIMMTLMAHIRQVMVVEGWSRRSRNRWFWTGLQCRTRTWRRRTRLFR